MNNTGSMSVNRIFLLFFFLNHNLSLFPFKSVAQPCHLSVLLANDIFKFPIRISDIWMYVFVSEQSIVLFTVWVCMYLIFYVEHKTKIMNMSLFHANPVSFQSKHERLCICCADGLQISVFLMRIFGLVCKPSAVFSCMLFFSLLTVQAELMNNTCQARTIACGSPPCNMNTTLKTSQPYQRLQ